MAVAAFLLWHALKCKNAFKYFSSGDGTRLSLPSREKNSLIALTDVSKVKKRYIHMPSVFPADHLRKL